MKKLHMVKFVIVTLAIGMVFGAGITWYYMQPKQDSEAVMWCKGHEKHCLWAKVRHDTLLKASDEVFFTNDLEK